MLRAALAAQLALQALLAALKAASSGFHAICTRQNRAR